MTTTPITYDDLYDTIIEIVPTATFDVDNEGQIIIYTGLTEQTVSILAPFDPESAPLPSYLCAKCGEALIADDDGEMVVYMTFDDKPCVADPRDGLHEVYST